METPWHELNRCYLIAEIGGNHEGDVERARALATAAADAGADAVKFQTYRAERLVNPRLSPERYEHFSRLQFALEDWVKLAEHVTQLGCDFMTSLWDPEQLTEFAGLVAGWKVGSGDLTNWSFIRQLMATGKAVVISTAMADLELVEQTLAAVAPEPRERRQLALLQCTALYDEPHTVQTQLAVMDLYWQRFSGVTVGFSNHHAGLDACLGALARGAEVLEVHFTDDKSQTSFRDHRLSVEAEELAELRRFGAKIPDLIGAREKRVMPAEREHVTEFRRGIFPKRDLDAGHRIAEEDLLLLRPEVGIPAQHYDDVVGRRTLRPVQAYEPLSLADVE